MFEIAFAGYMVVGAHEWLETLTGKDAEDAEEAQAVLEEFESAEEAAQENAQEPSSLEGGEVLQQMVTQVEGIVMEAMPTEGAVASWLSSLVTSSPETNPREWATGSNPVDV